MFYNHNYRENYHNIKWNLLYIYIQEKKVGFDDGPHLDTIASHQQNWQLVLMPERVPSALNLPVLTAELCLLDFWDKKILHSKWYLRRRQPNLHLSLVSVKTIQEKRLAFSSIFFLRKIDNDYLVSG